MVSLLRPSTGVRPLVGITGARIHAAEIASTPGILLHAFTDAYYAMYPAAVERAGGQPVQVPRENHPAAIAGRLDALVLAGGQDVDPRLYGRRPTAASTRLDPVRDRFELELALAAIQRDIPLLGICRGAQLLNVALGGTLIDDLACEQEIEHAVVLYPPDARVHEVQLSDGSLLREICGETVSVNSFHRQGIGDLGARVHATGFAPDGVIEGIEVAGARAVGVQWHPEMLSEIDPLLIWLIDQASASESSATLQKGPYGGHSA
jgi:putative glutamine amidotransferase